MYGKEVMMNQENMYDEHEAIMEDKCRPALKVVELRHKSKTLPPAYIYHCLLCNIRVGYGMNAINHLWKVHGMDRAAQSVEIARAADNPICPDCKLPRLVYRSSMGAPGVGSFYTCDACKAEVVKLGGRYYKADEVGPDALTPEWF
jgi:hypothetical protein